MKELFAKYAPTEAIDEPWAWALIDRGQDITYFKGYVDQPWRISRDRSRVEVLGDLTLESVAPYWAEFYGSK